MIKCNVEAVLTNGDKATIVEFDASEGDFSEFMLYAGRPDAGDVRVVDSEGWSIQVSRILKYREAK